MTENHTPAQQRLADREAGRATGWSEALAKAVHTTSIALCELTIKEFYDPVEVQCKVVDVLIDLYGRAPPAMDQRNDAGYRYALAMQALRKIAALRDREGDEPFDEALHIADSALADDLADPSKAVAAAIAADRPTTWELEALTSQLLDAIDNAEDMPDEVMEAFKALDNATRSAPPTHISEPYAVDPQIRRGSE